jgi:hypothetical protein
MAETNKLFQFVTPFISQIQEIEYMLDDLRTKRILSNATSAQLDGYGDILDSPRDGRNDTDYYITLIRKILYNTSSGQAPAIILFLSTITGKSVQYTEPYTATIRINLFTLLSPRALYQEVLYLVAAGVKLELYYAIDKTSSFNFGTENGHVTEGYGFLELNYDESHSYTAGKLIEKLTVF